MRRLPLFIKLAAVRRSHDDLDSARPGLNYRLGHSYQDLPAKVFEAIFRLYGQYKDHGRRSESIRYEKGWHQWVSKKLGGPDGLKKAEGEFPVYAEKNNYL